MFLINLNSVFHKAQGDEYLLDSNIVLDEPLVDCFGWVGHEDSASEVRLCKHIWK